MSVPVDHGADREDQRSVPPDRAAVLGQLARILDSREFRTARNRARFLEFVVGRTLDGAGDTLKEYTVGVEVFERGEAFDPRTDGVVRTQAGLVRKHLERYYAAEGRLDPIEIVLPKGHYIPHVHWRTAAEPPDDDAEETAGRHASGDHGAGGYGGHGGYGLGGRGSNGRPAAAAARDLADNGGRRGGRWLWPGIAATLVVATALTAALVARGIRTSPAAPAAKGGAAALSASDERDRLAIWGPFLAPDASNVLAFGIPQFFTAGGGVWIRDVEVNAPTDAAVDSRLAAIGRQVGPLTPSEAYTGIGEAYGVYLLSRFFLGGARELRVVRSPTLDWDNLKHDNVIFLTSARFKTLADQLSYPSAFLHVVGAPNRVVNVSPLPGEQAEYVSQTADRAYTDYAIISMWPGKLPGRRILVLSGGHTWGTQAAAEYVTETGYLRELNQHLLACRQRRGEPRHAEFFQVLLKVEVRDDQPTGVRYITHRDLALSETGELTAPPADARSAMQVPR